MHGFNPALPHPFGPLWLSAKETPAWIHDAVTVGLVGEPCSLDGNCYWPAGHLRGPEDWEELERATAVAVYLHDKLQRDGLEKEISQRMQTRLGGFVGQTPTGSVVAMMQAEMQRVLSEALETLKSEGNAPAGVERLTLSMGEGGVARFDLLVRLPDFPKAAPVSVPSAKTSDGS